MMNSFFMKKANVTRIPTPQNFAHYVDNSIYEMKENLNASRILIILSLFIHLISGVVIGGLWTFSVQLGAEVETIRLTQEGTIFKDGDIELIPIQIGGKNAK